MSSRAWVLTDESCPVCGDVFRVLTDAVQRDDGGWWVFDGDLAECCGCGLQATASADGEGAWIDSDGDDDGR